MNTTAQTALTNSKLNAFKNVFLECKVRPTCCRKYGEEG
jgi:hypothetical protein